jgi:hypothetical protein
MMGVAGMGRPNRAQVGQEGGEHVVRKNLLA